MFLYNQSWLSLHCTVVLICSVKFVLGNQLTSYEGRKAASWQFFLKSGGAYSELKYQAELVHRKAQILQLTAPDCATLLSLLAPNALPAHRPLCVSEEMLLPPHLCARSQQQKHWADVLH